MEFYVRDRYCNASISLQYANYCIKYYPEWAGSKVVVLNWNTQDRKDCKLNEKISDDEGLCCIADILITEAFYVCDELRLGEDVCYANGRVTFDVMFFSRFKNKYDERDMGVTTHVYSNITRILKPEIVQKTDAGRIRDYLAFIDHSSVRYVTKLDGMRGTKDSYCGDLGIPYGQKPNPDDYNKANDITMTINDIFKWQTKFYAKHVWSPGHKRKEN